MTRIRGRQRCRLLVEGLEDRALPAPITFGGNQLIAETGPRFASFRPESVSINQNGVVSFLATNTDVGQSLNVGDSTGLVELVRHVDPLGRFSSHTSINRWAAVAWEGTPDMAIGSGIFSSFDGFPGPLTIYISTSPTGIYNAAPSINDAHDVVFQFDSGTGVAVGRGGTPRILYDARLNVVPGWFGFIGEPAINNSGRVVFQGTRNGFNGQTTGIFTGTGDPDTTLIADISEASQFLSFGDAPSINEAGQVAFYGFLTDGAGGIFMGDATSMTAIARPSSELPFVDFAGAPSINNAGEVAFLAALSDGGAAIYRTLNLCGVPGTIRVIGTGDTLFGSTITALYFYREGLNDTDEFAYWAALADGREVVARTQFLAPIADCVPPDRSGAGPAGLLSSGVETRLTAEPWLAAALASDPRSATIYQPAEVGGQPQLVSTTIQALNAEPQFLLPRRVEGNPTSPHELDDPRSTSAPEAWDVGLEPLLGM